jgi:putative ABC transport system permease protein
MASSPDGAESVLVELKGVDRSWPLYGSFSLAPGAIAARPRGLQAAVAPELADRLALRVGDSLRVGAAQLRIVGLIAQEPDRVGQGFSMGSTVLVDPAGLAASGLVQPGSLYTSAYRLRLADPGITAAVREHIEARFRNAGFAVNDSSNAAPGVRRFIERLGQFLTLIGLTALVIAGIGVGNGVSSYLDS